MIPGNERAQTCFQEAKALLQSCRNSGLCVLAGFGNRWLVIFSELNAPLGMVACSKTFLKTEIWGVDEIES